MAGGAAKGAWSQTVFEVDDAPRYAGVGHWTHGEGIDAWTSDRTWRPLPRREYTKRNDYQALDVVNRHTLTPAGWVHEQDNTKLAIAADGKVTSLAREVGVNSYTRITDYDFGAGRTYWQKTSAFWSDVRGRWQRIEDANHEDANQRFTTSPEPNGEPRIDAFFTLAERGRERRDGVARRDRCRIREVRDDAPNPSTSRSGIGWASAHRHWDAPKTVGQGPPYMRVINTIRAATHRCRDTRLDGCSPMRLSP